MKTINSEIQGAQKTTSRINIKKTVPPHMVIKLLKMIGKR